MARIREDTIHFLTRQFLKQHGWLLVAGQYPNGSDDELCALNILDPELACDNSPDHRRHSKHKLVPDLVAFKAPYLILIEMKPVYAESDAKKLKEIVGPRKNDLLTALERFIANKRTSLSLLPDNFSLVTALAFSVESKHPRDDTFCYFKVSENSKVLFEGNKLLEAL